MRTLPVLLAVVSVALAGCPPPGALVVLDDPARVTACARPMQYGYLSPVTPDSLNRVLADDRTGSPVRLNLRNGTAVEATAARVEGEEVRYTPSGSSASAAVLLQSVSRLVVPRRTYGPANPVSLFVGRYQDQDVLVGCEP